MPFWEAQPSLAPVEWLLRAVTVYFFILVLLKIMGQREIGKLTLPDFIIAVTIGSIFAGVLTSSNTELKGPLIAMATLAGLEVILSVMSIKFSILRRVIDEEPIILVQNGKLLEAAMRKTRINLDDLMSQIRRKGYFNLNQIEFVVLEPGGKFSVLPKSQYRYVTPADLNISTQYEGYPVVLIEDGNVIQDNLQRNNLNEGWLKQQLGKYGVDSPSHVLAAVLDTQGNLFLSLKNNASERTSIA